MVLMAPVIVCYKHNCENSHIPQNNSNNIKKSIYWLTASIVSKGPLILVTAELWESGVQFSIFCQEGTHSSNLQRVIVWKNEVRSTYYLVLNDAQQSEKYTGYWWVQFYHLQDNVLMSHTPKSCIINHLTIQWSHKIRPSSWGVPMWLTGH